MTESSRNSYKQSYIINNTKCEKIFRIAASIRLKVISILKTTLKISDISYFAVNISANDNNILVYFSKLWVMENHLLD